MHGNSGEHRNRAEQVRHGINLGVVASVGALALRHQETLIDWGKQAYASLQDRVQHLLDRKVPETPIWDRLSTYLYPEYPAVTRTFRDDIHELSRRFFGIKAPVKLTFEPTMESAVETIAEPVVTVVEPEQPEPAPTDAPEPPLLPALSETTPMTLEQQVQQRLTGDFGISFSDVDFAMDEVAQGSLAFMHVDEATAAPFTMEQRLRFVAKYRQRFGQGDLGYSASLVFGDGRATRLISASFIEKLRHDGEATVWDGEMVRGGVKRFNRVWEIVYDERGCPLPMAVVTSIELQSAQEYDPATVPLQRDVVVFPGPQFPWDKPDKADIAS